MSIRRTKMTKRFSLALIALVALVMLILPASASFLVVNQGTDVFIGEENLNVANAVDGFAQIAWFASGTTPLIDTPNYILAVGNSASFYVSPADFVGKTGNWYRWNGTNQGVAFNVVDPSIDIKIWDQNAQKDVTGKNVPAGNIENFRIETNTYSVMARPDAAATPTVGYVTIKVKTADGATYTALENPSGGTTGLLNRPVNKSLYYWVTENTLTQGWQTDAVDDAGARLYKAGTYTVTAELNLNKIKDNYKAPDGSDYTGKTVTALKTIAITGDTVKIVASKDTVVRGNQFSVTVTGRANQEYYIWVKGTSSMDGTTGNQPPMMAAFQDGVTNDPVAGPYTIGAYPYEGGSGKTIKSDVAPQPSNGVYYYAKIKTSASGTRTVGFLTGPDTDDKKYTIRVENVFDGQYKSDEVDVKVEKGTVTVVASGDQSYFLGQEVLLSGTNSESDYVYLFITGPNLPNNGGFLDSAQGGPRVSVCGKICNSVGCSNTNYKLTVADVNDDNTWEYKWQTANLDIDAGTYTIYAVSDAYAKDGLSCAQYGTVSVIIRKPFVTAQASQSTVAQGDKIHVMGIAEGDPSQGVQIWTLGKNKAIVETETVNDDGTFDYEISGSETSDLTSGQYFVVVQHPMYNDVLDVYVGTGTNAGYVVGPYPVPNSRIFKMTGSGSLQGSDAANALTIALDNSAVDDTYTKLQFLVEVPEIKITPVTEKMVGDKFEVKGTTNLAVDDELLVEIYSSSFGPTPKEQTGEFSGVSGTVKVVKGTSGFNTWSFPVDTTTFKPDEYIVAVNAIGLEGANDVSATTLFNVVEFVPTTIPTTTVPPTNVTTTVPTTATPTPTPTTPGFGALVALIGLGAVAFLIVRKH